MSTRTDSVVVTVTIDGKKSISELGKLESSASDLKAEIKGLKKGTDDWIAANGKLDAVNADIKKMREQMGLAGMTIGQLTRYQRDLNKELNNVTIGTDKYDELKSKLDQVKGKLAETKTSVKSVGEEAKTGSGFVSSFFGNFVAGAAQQALSFIVDFGKESFAAWQESKAANAQVEASLKSTGNAAGLYKKDIDALAETLQNKINIDDDVIKQNAAVLLTFTNIKKGVFEEALPAITDLAAKMDGDMKGATIQVGKALNDPIKGISALTKVGVSFSAAQKDVITNLVETGKTAEAQKLILAELNKEFGGSALAAAEAEGPIGRFNIRVGELQEAIGEKLQQGTDGLLQTGADVVDFFNELVQESDPVIDAFGQVWDAAKGIWNAFSAVISAINPFNSDVNEAGVVMKTFATSITLAISPFKLLAAAIIYTIDLYGVLINNGKKVANFFGSEFKIDPSATMENANKKIATSTVKLTTDLIGIWVDTDKKTAESGQEATNARIAQQEELTAEQIKEAEKRQKALEKEIQDLEKEWQKLGDDINKIKDDNYLASLSKQDREIAATNAHYDKLLDDVTANEKRLLDLKIITQDQYTARLLEIETLRQQAVTKIVTDGETARMNEQQRINGELDALHMSAQEKEIQASNDYFDKLKKAAEDNELDTTRIEEERGKATQSINDKYHKAALDADKVAKEKELQQQRDLTHAKISLLSSFASLSAATNELISNNGGKQNDFQKLLTLSQIALNTASAIGSVIAGASAAAGSTGPAAPFVLAGYIASGLATVFTGIAQAKKALSDSKTPTVPSFEGSSGTSVGSSAGGTKQPTPRKAFAKGGYTDSVAGGGYVPSYQVASFGELGPEWVMPNWMLEHPAMANLVGVLEGVRLRGFAGGGFTDAPVSTAQISTPSTPVQSGQDYIKALIAEIRALRGDVRAQQKLIKAYVLLSDIQDAEATLTDIQNEAAI